MDATRIEIPDEAWLNWPAEPGWYFIGNPGMRAQYLEHVSSRMLQPSKKSGPTVFLSSAFAIAMNESEIRPDSGYRFARVELPTIPAPPQ